MAERSGKPPLYGRSAMESLHTLKDIWAHQKRYLGDQCQALVAHLDEAIKATLKASPQRLQPFNPDGSRRKRRAVDRMAPSSKERLLEAAIWTRWRFDAAPTGQESRLWAMLVGFQVPLFDSRRKKGWGHIDLLGIDKAGAPVVVELKKGENDEVPLRPVLEVVSYAIALRRNWGRFAEQLGEQLREAGRHYTPCGIDAPFPCVVLAPSLYWKQWGPDGKLGKSVSVESRRAFRELLAALKGRGYPVTFGHVNDVSTEVCSFPMESP